MARNINLLIRLAESQNWRCCYCCLKMELVVHERPQPANAATFEHIVPKVRSGTNRWENLVAACWQCNNLRGHINAHVFHDIIQALVARPEIRDHWHRLSPQHRRLLYKEVHFGRMLIEAKADTEEGLRMTKRAEHMKQLRITQIQMSR